jgi:hypothetical protein
MKQITIADPTIRRVLIEHVIELLDGGGMDQLLHAGYSPEFLDNLRQRPTRDLIHIAGASIEVSFSIPEECIENNLRLLDMRRGHVKLREYFIQHGASRRMVFSYFKLSHDEYRELREMLFLGKSGGRTPMPPAAVRDAIHRTWYELRKTMSDLPICDLIYTLHHDHFPDLRINTLQQTIAEFNEDELKLDPPPPQD